MTEIEERIQEIRAWRSLWKEEFDFGEVKGKAEYPFWDDWVLTEEEIRLELVRDYPIKEKKFKTHNRPRQKEQDRLARKFKNTGWDSQIYFDDFEYRNHIPKYRYKKTYLSGRRKYAKWCSDRAVRHNWDLPKRPGGYRRAFDYSWCVW